MPPSTGHKLTLRQQIEMLRDDPLLFIENCVKIVTKEGNLVPFKLTTGQRILHNETRLSSRVQVLKSRQIGASTLFHAQTLHETLFKTNNATLLVFHGDEPAKAALQTIKSMYENLPEVLRKIPLFAVEESNSHTFSLANGSRVVAYTSNSEKARSRAFQRLHASEIAFWDDSERTLKALLPALAADAPIIIESTANGLNHFYKLWKGDSSYRKIFVNWKYDERAVSSVPAGSDNSFKEFLAGQSLKQEQINWLWSRYQDTNRSIVSLKQEYPARPEDAFVLSGTRYFSRTFFDLSEIKTGVWPTPPFQPSRSCHYTMGVDVASGSPDGDYSAYCICEVEQSGKAKIVETYYDRIKPLDFARVIVSAVKRFKPKVCVERNDGGAKVLIDELSLLPDLDLYIETRESKLVEETTKKVGFTTSENTRPRLVSHMSLYLDRLQIPVEDTRLQHEINTFVYNGRRPEHSPGQHDDLLFAFALAIEAISQVNFYKSPTDLVEGYHKAIRELRAPTIEEAIAHYESTHGEEFNGISLY